MNEEKNNTNVEKEETKSQKSSPQQQSSAIEIKLSTPSQIKAYLDQYVIGQDEAKKVLSVAVYNHYKRVFANYGSGYSIDKSNILMLGETGTGKTYMVKTIARLLNVPCYIADSTKLSETGYVGSDVESILSGALQNCNYDVARTEISIIFIDEIDKLAKKGDGPSITRDVSGEGVQQGLLKIIEGDIVGVPPQGGRKHPEQPLININTNNILFIGCGAFVGMDKIIKRRINNGTIGFQNNLKDERLRQEEEKNILQYTNAQDLRTYGLIPEFIGRFPVITSTRALTLDDLCEIIAKPSNSILSQFKTLFKMDGAELDFDEKAVEEVAKIALEMKIGARGLRSIMETVLIDYMFQIPDLRKENEQTKITVTAEEVRKKAKEKFRLLLE